MVGPYFRTLEVGWLEKSKASVVAYPGPVHVSLVLGPVYVGLSPDDAAELGQALTEAAKSLEPIPEPITEEEADGRASGCPRLSAHFEEERHGNQ